MNSSTFGPHKVIVPITLCGPKVEEYNEKFRDIALAQEYKLDQQLKMKPAL
jgi:hypothetical protein